MLCQGTRFHLAAAARRFPRQDQSLLSIGFFQRAADVHLKPPPFLASPSSPFSPAVISLLAQPRFKTSIASLTALCYCLNERGARNGARFPSLHLPAARRRRLRDATSLSELDAQRRDAVRSRGKRRGRRGLVFPGPTPDTARVRARIYSCEMELRRGDRWRFGSDGFSLRCQVRDEETNRLDNCAEFQTLTTS